MIYIYSRTTQAKLPSVSLNPAEVSNVMGTEITVASADSSPKTKDPERDLHRENQRNNV